MKPRVLVAEDDPTSGLFFREVLGRAGLDVALATDGAGALALAARHPFAAWLVDAHLPDGDAASLLPRLLGASAPAPPRAAIAHTASRSPALHAALLAAGYVEVLAKPFDAATLVSAVQRHLRTGVREAPVPWDDAAASLALGCDGSVAALRARFLAELPGDIACVQRSAAAGDTAGVRATLHRLAAACAFVGAPSLADAARRLHAAPCDVEALADFVAAASRMR